MTACFLHQPLLPSYLAPLLPLLNPSLSLTIPITIQTGRLVGSHDEEGELPPRSDQTTEESDAKRLMRQVTLAGENTAMLSRLHGAPCSTACLPLPADHPAHLSCHCHNRQQRRLGCPPR